MLTDKFSYKVDNHCKKESSQGISYPQKHLAVYPKHLTLDYRLKMYLILKQNIKIMESPFNFKIIIHDLILMISFISDVTFDNDIIINDIKMKMANEN